jgi:hypothetical protein
VHRHRVRKVTIVVPRDSGPSAVEFWTAAFGAFPRSDGSGAYTELVGVSAETEVAIEQADLLPHYRVDIEADDTQAETCRLVSLGATVISQQHEDYRLITPGGDKIRVLPMEKK